MKMTPEERAKRFLEIQKHFERGDVDSIFNEQLKTLVETDITIIDRISPRKTAVFSMITAAILSGGLTFQTTHHLYSTALALGFQLGHDYVVKYKAIPDEEVDLDSIESLLDFDLEEDE